MKLTFIKQIFGESSFTESELILLAESFRSETLLKNEFLLKEGAICKNIYILASGTAYQYEIDTNNEEQIINLYSKHHWIIDYQSFTTQRPSSSYIKIREKSIVYAIHMDQIHNLISQSQRFFKLGTFFLKPSFRSMLLRKEMSVLERYKELLKIHPEFMQEFPQKVIASYLNSTPETLSRIRNKISKE